MKLKDYMNLCETGEEVTCWDNVVDGEFYFYKKDESEKPDPDFLHLAELEDFLQQHLEVKKIGSEGITVSLYEYLDHPTVIAYAKEHLYEESQYNCDEDVVILLFDDMVTNLSSGYDHFSEQMLECFKDLEAVKTKENIYSSVTKAEIETDINKHYGIIRNLILTLNNTKAWECYDIDNENFIDWVCKNAGMDEALYKEILQEELGIEQKASIDEQVAQAKIESTKETPREKEQEMGR